MTAHFSELKDASVYITGGGNGIGAALTEGFLKQGARVAIVGRSDATEFCDDMEQKHGNRPYFMQCDITDISRLKETMDEASARHGTITTLINNAANDKRHATGEIDDSFYNWMMDINFKAYVFACQHAAPLMAAAGGGSIINFTSISYMMGNAGYPLYTAANSAINGLTRSLAREFGPDKIRVNALAPGWVLTQKQKDMWVTKEGLAAHLERQCLDDPLAPEDIVGGTLFLASDLSRAMTGQSLVIDGGVVVTG
ncbi:SDR family NAD(P)-dependent oxidoreductase [Planktotalea sp.]|uniref:SDR family NAD(P)-dependent oxidoreductase n=1 Tax=Planktotalea sp. TaxID=2029877 RepID=UPI003F6C3698